MRKVLIITYYWPPAGGGGVQRWLKFTKYLPRHGWQPVVYAPSNADYPLQDESLLHEVAGDVEVVRQPIREPRRIYRKLLGKSDSTANGKTLDQLFYIDPKSRTWKQSLGIWLRGNLFVPDARVWWVRPSIRFLVDYIRGQDIQMVVTTGPPHSMHLIALGLKRRMPGIRWVADFRDPWTAIEYYDRMMLSRRADRLHQTLERQVLRTADAVVTVSPSWAQMLGGIREGEVELITNGYDAADFTQPGPEPDKSMTICHVGTLALDRNPEFFWTMMKDLSEELPDLEIKLLGSTDPGVLRYLNNLGLNYQDLGYLAHDRAIAEMRKAHALLLLINEAVRENIAGRIPGKLFEYLAAGRPVIGVCPRGTDAAGILQEHGHLVIEERTDASINELRDYLAQHHGRVVTKPPEKYSRSYLAASLSDLLTRVANQKS